MKKFNKVEYNNAFIAKAYDRINLTVPKGMKELIKECADEHGKSVNGFLLDLINEAINKDQP